MPMSEKEASMSTEEVRQERKDEAKGDLELAFDRIFQRGAQPEAFDDFLTACVDAMAGIAEWRIQEKYGTNAVAAWRKIVQLIRDTETTR